MYDCGLILEGGGMRGVYTAGVLDLFLEKGYEFKNVFGVSAGACHACSFLSKQKGRAFRVNVDYIDDKNYGGFVNWVKTGSFFNNAMLFDEIPNELDPYDYDAFNRNESDLYAVATNCITGKAECLKVYDMKRDIDAICASSSLPLMAKVVSFRGGKYMDGGIADPIPVKKSIEMGNDKNVVVLTRQAGYRKQEDKTLKVIRKKYGKIYPHMVAAMERRHIVYNDTLDFIEKAEKDGSVFVIRPSANPNIGRLEKNRKKLEKLYEMGYRDAERVNGELKRFLEK
ncbi:MAG: patatin family protein [Lachnospiraceae bacterium]|nr:patatin family protein [Lachnospiraceae bacterium]